MYKAPLPSSDTRHFVEVKPLCGHQWLVLFLLLLAVLPAKGKIGVAYQIQLGNPSNATNDSSDHSHYLIERIVQAIDYNERLGEPNWASWDLTAEDLGASGRNSSFYKDTSLPQGFYQVPTTAYASSGYDRGHLCPSADRTVDDATNKMVFFMTNVFPQAPDNNQGPWAIFEAYCRLLAEDGYEMLIICGGSAYSSSTLGNGKVAIPGVTWKVAVVVPPGSGSAISRIGYSTRVISIEMPNADGIRSTPWSRFVSSAGHIESATGLLFFSALPSDIAEVLRAKVDGAPAPIFNGFNISSAFPGSEVVLSGRGFTASSKVMFNGTSASFTVDSDSQIRTTVPYGATDGFISIITPGGLATSSKTFKVIMQPTISGFSPTVAAVGQSVIIRGSGFSSASSVTFNGQSASFNVDSASQIAAIVPTGTVSGLIRVSTPNGTAISSDSFVLRPAPGFDTWIAEHFTSEEQSQPSIAGASGNPSGDGMSNLAKYAFGLDPHRPNASTAITYNATTADRMITLILNHRKNHSAEDVTFSYEVSYNLINWILLESPETSTTRLDDQTDSVSVTVTSPDQRLYMRVRVNH